MFASSSKGTPLSCAGNFPATAKSRPLGEGGLTRSGKTEGVIPQRRAFVESGAANAVCLHDPSRENSVWSAPQSATNAKLKIILPLIMVRAPAETIFNPFFHKHFGRCGKTARRVYLFAQKRGKISCKIRKCALRRLCRTGRTSSAPAGRVRGKDAVCRDRPLPPSQRPPGRAALP